MSTVSDDSRARGNAITMAIVVIFSLIYLSDARLFEFSFTNEVDTFAFARHRVDPGWVSNDWYLNRAISYRLFADYLIGTFLSFFHWPVVLIAGRLASYLVFSFVVAKIYLSLGLRWYMAGLVLVTYFFSSTIGAGEWMVGGLEAKVFAYLCVLSSLASLMSHRMRTSVIFAGLAIDFHVLVGAFALFAMAVPYIRFVLRSKRRVFDLGLDVLILLVVGSWGFFQVGSHLVGVADVSNVGSLIYVMLRVPHHVLPSSWPDAVPYTKLVIFAMVLLIARYKFMGDHAGTSFVEFAMGSFVLFAVGLLLFHLEAYAALKYYWFRLGDVILPFAVYPCVGVMFQRVFASEAVVRSLSPKVRRWALSLAIVAMTTYWGGHLVKRATSLWQKTIDSQWSSNLNHMVGDRKALFEWIRNHSERNAVWLIDPAWSDFYLLAERPVLVTFKNSPQSEADMVEWHRRLEDVNGEAFPVRLQGFELKDALSERFWNLEHEDIRSLASRYGLGYVISKKADLGWPLVKSAEPYFIYSLKTQPFRRN